MSNNEPETAGKTKNSQAPLVAVEVEARIGLDDFIVDLQARDSRHELTVAFQNAMRRDSVHFSTAPDYQARYEEFINRPVR